MPAFAIDRVDPAVLRKCVLHDLGRVARLGDIGDDVAATDAVGDVLEGRLVATHGDDRGSLLRQREGGGPPDAVTGTGDDDSGASEIHSLIVPGLSLGKHMR